MTLSTPQAKRNRVASLTSRFGAGAPEVIEARQDLAAAKLEAYIARVVAESPPLTEAQRDRLASLLRAATTPTRELRRPATVDERIIASGDVQ